MNLFQIVLFQLTIILSCFSIISNGIRCYQCGTEAIFIHYDEKTPPLTQSRIDELENTALAIESCSNLEYSGAISSWGLYAVDCGANQMCVKTVRDAGFDETGRHHYVTSSRGCAMRNSSFGTFHPHNCGVLKTNYVPPADALQNKLDLVCFCDTDYCNGANGRESTFFYFRMMGEFRIGAYFISILIGFAVYYLSNL